MPLIITEEQTMLKTSTREFLTERAAVASLRQLRDLKDTTGFDRQLWKDMANMGWASLTIPEAYGGLEFGYTGLGQVLEETGRTLTASPLISTILLGATCLQLAGNQLQKEKLLPAIAAGEKILTLAIDESNRHQPGEVATTASRTQNGYLINGQKLFVLDGHVADQVIVLARTSGESNEQDGQTLFLVDTNTEGLTITRTIMMDSRNAATLDFDQVEVPAAAMLGEPGEAAQIVEQVLDIARIGLSAEMLGTMTEAFDRTLTYLKEREQFGRPIGSFQALQHRAAQLFCEIELCKSLVIKSLQAIDKNAEDLPVLASLTKAKIGETLDLVTNEAIQLFGGIGMTDDEEIGFFLKRARVAQQTFGDSHFHLDRFARLNDY